MSLILTLHEEIFSCIRVFRTSSGCKVEHEIKEAVHPDKNVSLLAIDITSDQAQ
jgi:hypothetical protein